MKKPKTIFEALSKMYFGFTNSFSTEVGEGKAEFMQKAIDEGFAIEEEHQYKHRKKDQPKLYYKYKLTEKGLQKMSEFFREPSLIFEEKMNKI